MVCSMCIAVLSGQLAAKAAADKILESESKQYETIPQLTERPLNKEAEGWNEITPDKQLYRVRVAETPKQVQTELDSLCNEVLI